MGKEGRGSSIKHWGTFQGKYTKDLRERDLRKSLEQKKGGQRRGEDSLQAENYVVGKNRSVQEEALTKGVTKNGGDHEEGRA